MSAKRVALSLASVIVFLAVITPKSAVAITRIVISGNDQCTADNVTSICYGNLTDAINASNAGDAIEIHPGTYTGNFTISKNITTIYGIDTAKTFISGGGSGTALTLGTITGNISIKRLTFVSASTAILANDSPSVSIDNNIFEAGSNSTAIQLSRSSNAVISNNVFYQSLNGIVSDTIQVNIKNNIFSSILGTAITATVDITNILNNLFINCNNIGPTTISFDPSQTAIYKGNLQNQDPLFVSVAAADVTQRDFHLQAGSPCINAGNPSVGNDSVDSTTPDMGVYGGPDADTIPFQITGVSATTSGTTIQVSWAANIAYTVAGYRVYYGSASGVYNGTAANEGASPITVPTGTAATSFTLTGLASAATPSVPTLLSTSPLDGGLILTWAAAPGATGYNVYFGVTSTPTTSIAVGNVTSYKLTGLTNGQTYALAVSAISQATNFIAVTAIDSAGPALYSPGVAHESAFSQEVVGGSGDIKESALSNILSDFPEALVPYPNLSDSGQGCFIATAAYGYYSAPQVQALRNFRDRFLLTNRPGSMFVAWYYTNGPAAADWLNKHPQYKPLIRAALLPAVGMAIFLTQTSPAFNTGLMILTTCIICYTLYRRRLSRGGGIR